MISDRDEIINEIAYQYVGWGSPILLNDWVSSCWRDWSFLHSHIITKRQNSISIEIVIYSSYDDILKYRDFDVAKSDALTKFVSISECIRRFSQFGLQSENRGFSLFLLSQFHFSPFKTMAIQFFFHDALVRSPEVIHAKFRRNRPTKSGEIEIFVQRQNYVHTCPICVPP